MFSDIQKSTTNWILKNCQKFYGFKLDIAYNKYANTSCYTYTNDKTTITFNFYYIALTLSIQAQVEIGDAGYTYGMFNLDACDPEFFVNIKSIIESACQKHMIKC